MHGLVCKSLEEFVRSRHGDDTWLRIVQASALHVSRFEILSSYDDLLMRDVFLAAFRELGLTNTALLEDIGHWICTHPPLEAARRLIRFSGTNFVDLVYSLDEMHERARIALPGLEMPRVQLTQTSSEDFDIRSIWHLEGSGAVLTGLLRAMSDDYGVLVLIDPGERSFDGTLWQEKLTMRIFDPTHQAPREFTLGDVA